LNSSAGRWVVAAAVLGSGAVFLESTVVNVALPAIGRGLDLGMEGLQWVLNGYLLSLGSLILLGGALGDVHRRRIVFAWGLAGFAASSVLCALATNLPLLVASRILQGAAGALVVPNSLALLDILFAEEDRAPAIGQWAGWSAVSTAAGPLLGGWLVDAGSWRMVFICVVPFAGAAALIAARKVPEAESSRERRSLDVGGAALATLGLAGVVAALVSGSRLGWSSPPIVASAALGSASLVAFGLLERRVAEPLLPLDLFRSRQFSGANLATVLIYAALAGLLFFLVLQLQNVLGYGALQAGAALMPVNALMLVLSPLAGRLSHRIGARAPMTMGALLAALGMMLLADVERDSSYVRGILPGLIVFGVGLATLVAPLTAAVLGAVPDERAGIASAVNNAAARLAGLLASAALPLAAGVAGLTDLSGGAFSAGYGRAMRISAALCAAGGVVAFATIRRQAPVPAIPHPSPGQGCIHRRAGGKAGAHPLANDLSTDSIPSPRRV
jgi:EmrB/QacA subfamily drug resistance transporter